MTEETKKLFDAPFAVMGDSEDYTKFNVIIHSRNSPRYCSTIASCIDRKTAIRFARLPELYEALKEAVDDACGTCAMMQVDSNSYDFVKNGCPFFEDHDDCFPIKWIEVLRKIRYGE